MKEEELTTIFVVCQSTQSRVPIFSVFLLARCWWKVSHNSCVQLQCCCGKWFTKVAYNLLKGLCVARHDGAEDVMKSNRRWEGDVVDGEERDEAWINIITSTTRLKR